MKIFVFLFLLLNMVSLPSQSKCEIDTIENPFIKRFVKDEQSWEMRTDPKMMRWDIAHAPHHQKAFEIQGCWIDFENFRSLADVEVFEAKDKSSVSAQFLRTNSEGKNEVNFFFHPEALAFYETLGLTKESLQAQCKAYCATPTSSNRTLVVWKTSDDHENFLPVMVKTSLWPQNFPDNKLVTYAEAKQSIQVNDDLDNKSKISDLGFRYMREPFAISVIPKKKDSRGKEGAGMVVREFPQELLDGSRHIVSAIALFGDAVTKKDSEPYLFQSFNQNADEIENHLIEKLINPFAKTAVLAALNHDLSLEAHSQNILLEIDGKNKLTGTIWYRDLDGIERPFGYAHFTNVLYLERSISSLFSDVVLGQFQIALDKRIKAGKILAHNDPSKLHTALLDEIINVLAKTTKHSINKIAIMSDESSNQKINLNKAVKVIKVLQSMEKNNQQAAKCLPSFVVADELNDFYDLSFFGFDLDEFIKNMNVNTLNSCEKALHYERLETVTKIKKPQISLDIF